MSFFADKSVLVTGGSGSFGRRFIRDLLAGTTVRRVVVFSRDEFKQSEMQGEIRDPRLRYFIGDVRDQPRLRRALTGVNIVVHAAAMKQVPAAEYNPFEAVKTNIQGAQNLIESAIDQGVDRVIALSTDKASSPVNLYGATKLVSDKLFVAGNAYAAGTHTRFSVVRYGNVVGSRGSVIPLFRKLAETGRIPVTDARMTRFWITLEQGAAFVRTSLERMRGGEIFVPKIPSMRLTDLAAAIAPQAKIEVVGIRPGEKLHEEMISVADARHTTDLGDRYVIWPEMDWWPSEPRPGRTLAENFAYTSDTNDDWLDVERLRGLVDQG